MRALERLFAMYAAAVPEVREASGSSDPVDPVLVSAADKAILELMREEIAAELRIDRPVSGGDDDEGEEDHA